MTDHTWFNVPKNLQHGLIETYVLKLLKDQPRTAAELIGKIASTMEIWLSPSEILSCLSYMKEHGRVQNNAEVFSITTNGKEKIEDSAREIANFIHQIDPSFSIFCSCKTPAANPFGMDNSCAKCSKPIIDSPLMPLVKVGQ